MIFFQHNNPLSRGDSETRGELRFAKVCARVRVTSIYGSLVSEVNLHLKENFAAIALAIAVGAFVLFAGASPLANTSD
jgi:hypothetical protein